MSPKCVQKLCNAAVHSQTRIPEPSPFIPIRPAHRKNFATLRIPLLNPDHVEEQIIT